MANAGSEAHVIRRATRDDIPRIMETRALVRENRLRDPSRVTVEDVCWFLDNPGIFVWIEDGDIVGFSAGDPRTGNIYALFVGQAYEGAIIPSPPPSFRGSARLSIRKQSYHGRGAQLSSESRRAPPGEALSGGGIVGHRSCDRILSTHRKRHSATD
jgi:hypothetical protein